MQCAYAVLSSVACPAVRYFPRYLINGTIFGKKSYWHKMSFDFLYEFGLKHSHSRNN